MDESKNMKAVWFYQDWDDPCLYHVRISGEKEEELMTIEEAWEKYPSEKYTVLIHEWDDLDGTRT